MWKRRQKYTYVRTQHNKSVIRNTCDKTTREGSLTWYLPRDAVNSVTIYCLKVYVCSSVSDVVAKQLNVPAKFFHLQPLYSFVRTKLARSLSSGMMNSVTIQQSLISTDTARYVGNDVRYSRSCYGTLCFLSKPCHFHISWVTWNIVPAATSFLMAKISKSHPQNLTCLYLPRVLSYCVRNRDSRPLTINTTLSYRSQSLCKHRAVCQRQLSFLLALRFVYIINCGVWRCEV